MATQQCRRLVDAPDVGPDCLARPAPGHHEVGIVGLHALQVVDHQVSAMRLNRRFEPLDGREQVDEIFGALGAGRYDPAAPQPRRDFRHRRGSLFCFFVVVPLHM